MKSYCLVYLELCTHVLILVSNLCQVTSTFNKLFSVTNSQLSHHRDEKRNVAIDKNTLKINL